MSMLDTFLNYRVFVDTLPLILSGLSTTLLLGITCIVIGFVAGIVLAILRLYAPQPLKFITVAYIDVFRSIPVLVLLFIVYYALPFAGIRLTSFTAAASAISMISAAYSAEIIRAGIEAIPRGQFEAARALGLHFYSTMAKVILPQAIKIVVPPLTSNAINVVKDTALASVVAMPDLLKQANQAQALAANPTPLITAAIIYLLILLPLVRLVGVLEKHMARTVR
ncbi:ABC transporter permease subunit [Mesorhizobium sp. NBSH29]|uniref:amino acid ABC transporter permease n=1 Tax=Mesorhizobium sp. NBSH29 TaxID=2654249 RepID=UPI0018964D00|nr:amino acid ABC transporter permease [Mesorhizobium sp. NBSH29]QPC88349.1 ABC transporter permease subunit [Mesorhizobium sp. NBSH29]